MEERDGSPPLSLALGWFSIALGLAELAAPRGVARLIGVNDDDDNRRLLQVMGLREIAAGVAILAQPEKPAWLWVRVAGDMLDLGLLGTALDSEESDRRRVAAATAAVLGATALDVVAARRLGARENGNGAPYEQPSGIEVRKTITVVRSPEEVYTFWRDFRNLPQFMRHLDSVTVTGDRRSRWRARAPAGTAVEWDAEVIEDRPNELISWRSLPGADVDNSGSVRFVSAPGGRGTELHVELRYDPPGGRLGATLAKLFGRAPDQEIAEDLRRFKQVIETGEVVQSDASIHPMPHPARPPGEI